MEGCRQSCEYFGVCGRGACRHKYWENGTFASTETLLCQYRIQVITDLILESLEQAMGIES
ncbi:MAG: hypothetical protein AB4290_28820 [Spirulina sp.]